MTKQHTDEAVRAAKRWFDYPTLRPCYETEYIDALAAIIEQETASPDLLKLFAERDRLRKALIEAITILGNDYCEDSRMDHAVKTLRAALAKEPESGETNPKGDPK